MKAPSSLPRVIGHRGAAGHAPENTLAGFRTAASLGVKWVEFDVHLSLDGVPVLLHDDSLDRTTDGKGGVSNYSLGTLQGYDAGQWFSETYVGETIPTLSETIRLLASLQMGANVEIKPSPGQEAATGHAVGRALREEWPGDLPAPLISSFTPASLAAVRETAPMFQRGLLLPRVARDWGDDMRALDCRTLHCNHRHLDKTTAQEIRRAGYPLLCYTVNDRARADTLFEWGVDTVISDHPDRML